MGGKIAINYEEPIINLGAKTQKVTLLSSNDGSTKITLQYATSIIATSSQIQLVNPTSLSFSYNDTGGNENYFAFLYNTYIKINDDENIYYIDTQLPYVGEQTVMMLYTQYYIEYSSEHDKFPRYNREIQKCFIIPAGLTNYNITSGRTKIQGTNYKIFSGKTLIDNTNRTIVIGTHKWEKYEATLQNYSLHQTQGSTSLSWTTVGSFYVAQNVSINSNTGSVSFNSQVKLTLPHDISYYNTSRLYLVPPRWGTNFGQIDEISSSETRIYAPYLKTQSREISVTKWFFGSPTASSDDKTELNVTTSGLSYTNSGQIYYSEGTYNKGDYISDIYDSDSNAYPNNGIQKGYWYVKIY